MKKIKLAVVSLAAFIGVVTLTPVSVFADPTDQIRTGVTEVGGDTGGELGPQLKTVIDVLFYILGTIAVIMIVIGGIRYTTSNGDTGAVTSAKNTILYSVVGLIVAILSYAIVNFVVDSFQ